MKRSLEELNAIIDSWDEARQVKAYMNVLAAADVCLDDSPLFGMSEDERRDCQKMIETMRLTIDEANRVGHQ